MRRAIRFFELGVFYIFFTFYSPQISADEVFLGLFNSGQYPQALAHLEESTRKNPEKIFAKETLFNFALASWQTGLYQQALAYLMEARQRYPFDPKLQQLYKFFQQERPQGRIISNYILSSWPVTWPLNWSLFAMAFTVFVWVILFFLSFLKMKSPILGPKTTLKRVTLFAGALALMSSLTASYQVFSLWDWETLVTQTGASLKTRPDPAAPDLSQISEGEKVRILKVLQQDSGQNSWAMVELDSGLRGWIALAHLHLLEKHPVLFQASPSQQIKSFLIFEVVKLEPLKNLN